MNVTEIPQAFADMCITKLQTDIHWAKEMWTWIREKTFLEKKKKKNTEKRNYNLVSNGTIKMGMGQLLTLNWPPTNKTRIHV